jgi:hypothetical protein
MEQIYALSGGLATILVSLVGYVWRSQVRLRVNHTQLRELVIGEYLKRAEFQDSMNGFRTDLRVGFDGIQSQVNLIFQILAQEAKP